MKTKFYLHTSVTGLLSICFSIQKVNAQCPCSSGGGQVVQTLVLDPITALTTPIEFDAFDSNIGTLTCLKLTSTVTTIASFHLYNNEISNTSSFLFESYRRSQFSGPGGFFISNISPAQNYGPYLLGPKDLAGTGDEAMIGPLTIFNNLNNETYFYNNMAEYLGAGTVTFNYLNTYTNTMLTGSSNHTLDVTGTTRLELELTYYWCPQTALSVKDKKSPALPASSNEMNGTQFSSIYPNPISGGKFSLQFNKPVTGSYRVDVVNSTGQKIYSGNLQVKNTQQVPVDMNSIPLPGLYYLRATDQRTGAVHMNKLLVK